MKKGNRNLWNVLFLVLVFGLTVHGIFKGENITELLADLRQVNAAMLLPAVMCVLFFIWGESVVIHYLMSSFLIPVKKWTCFLFSCVGFFFSSITPSASGGQPMQIYYMKKEKIPVPVSSVVLLIVTITYKLVLVVIGIGILLTGKEFVQRYLTEIKPVFYLGLILNTFCILILLLLVFRSELTEAISWNVLSCLEKLRILKDAESRKKKLSDSMKLYHAAAGYLKSHRKLIADVFVVTLLQRTALFAVTYFVYRAFRLTGTSAADILLLQAVISISVDMLPLPGGMGISETLFLLIFVPVFGNDFLVPALILSRGIAYYAQLLISAAMTVTAQFTLGKRGKQ